MNWFSSRSPKPPYEIDDAVLTLTQKDAARLEWPIERQGSAWLFGCSLLVLVIFFGRFGYLNIVRGGEYQAMAERNSLRSIVLSAPRGIITNRFGVPLVENEPSLDAAIVPGDLPGDHAGRTQVLENIKSFFGPDEETWASIMTRLDGGSFQPMLLKDHLEQGVIIHFLAERQKFPGIILLKTAERKYIDGTVFSHIIGYEGKIRADELAERKDAK